MEYFEFCEVPWSAHYHFQAGISLQFYKGTDCSIRAIKEHITLYSGVFRTDPNRAWWEVFSSPVRKIPWFSRLLHTLLMVIYCPGFVMWSSNTHSYTHKATCSVMVLPPRHLLISNFSSVYVKKIKERGYLTSFVSEIYEAVKFKWRK